MSKQAMISVRIPDALYDQLCEAARGAGLTVSEYVRRIVVPQLVDR